MRSSGMRVALADQLIGEVMDPNVTLAFMRQRVRDVDTADVVDLEGFAADLAMAVRSLDEWLSKGGFLPQDWSR